MKCRAAVVGIVGNIVGREKAWAGGSVLCTKNIFGVARTLTCMHRTRTHTRAQWVGSPGRYQRTSFSSGLPGYTQVDRFNGIFKWHARPYLHSTLRGPPTKFFPRERHYDPPRAFHGGHSGSYRHFTKIVRRRKTVETVVCHTLRVC